MTKPKEVQSTELNEVKKDDLIKTGEDEVTQVEKSANTKTEVITQTPEQKADQPKAPEPNPELKPQ